MSYPYVQILKETTIFCEKTERPGFIALSSLGWPGTHYVEQAGLGLRDPPAAASRVANYYKHNQPSVLHS